MNILALNNLKLGNSYNNQIKQNKMTVPSWGLKMNAPLREDTVTFSTQPQAQDVAFKATPTAKFLTTRTGGVSKATAKEINAIAEESQPAIQAFMRSIFSDLIVTEKKPNNLIAFISGRAKKPDSIAEKSKIMQENKKVGILKRMTDLNGVKIVLTDGSRKNVHKTLGILLDAVKKGLVYVEEVEPKRPKAAAKLKGKERSKWDYADPAFLQKFIKEAEQAMKRPVTFEDPSTVSGTKANYTALHFLLRLPGQKRPFELQLMGPSVAKFKHLDDILFKILNNKNVDKKYQPIVDVLKPLVMTQDDKTMAKYIKLRDKMDKLKFTQAEYEKLTGRITMGDEKLIKEADSKEYSAKVDSLLRSKDVKREDLNILADNVELESDYQDKTFVKNFRTKVVQHDLFADYRAEAFLFQRTRPPIKYSADDSREYFLPMTVDLPGEYDLNKLNRMLIECEKKGADSKTTKK